MRAPIRDIVAHFWSKVDRTAGPLGCWRWLGGLDDDGYGKFQIPLGDGRQRHVRAHKHALFLATGTSGELAMHSCDNPPCCNPDHLSWSTHAENRKDCARKGRTAKGTANGNGKLTDEQIAQIRADFQGGASARELAAKFAIHRGTVYAIARGTYPRVGRLAAAQPAETITS